MITFSLCNREIWMSWARATMVICSHHRREFPALFRFGARATMLSLAACLSFILFYLIFFNPPSCLSPLSRLSCCRSPSVMHT
ncbi:uncharacterized protein BDW43DRAFT_280090 [Aspergillus alliaceus]|uniref:uncharacterized protein n=1 Tax=Petromyces alliaceus TaxID=209559 RepID=UPI0012A4BAFB|nr:uncharacterized protein BDW43DRAFT_280090 [Aspergillus alliaceus]KAB8232334.1 hypothetical protein BDW43DRAFT_280090 [Aspergillus alliaceus]